MCYVPRIFRFLALEAAFAMLAALQAAPNPNATIPNGTILPARLDSTLSSKTSKAGQIIRGRLMQDVVLPNGSKLRMGTTIVGKVISALPRADGRPASITFQFDGLRANGMNEPLSASLRAVASFIAVGDTQVPDFGADRGTSPDDRTTTQIGGDVVYRGGGPVEGRSGEVVGKPTYDGVLVHVSANPDRGCPSAPAAETFQSLWVFSSDACGTYGLDTIKIAHHGRTNPCGEITLTSPNREVVVRSGAGLLLEVQTAPQGQG